MKIVSLARVVPLLLAFCLTAVPAHADAMNVTVSIVPQKYVVEKIGGSLVDCSIMVQPGASPATYEPKPGQMTALSKASLYFAIGVPFEKAWLPRIAAAGKSMRVVHMEDSIKKVPMAAHHHHEHGEEPEAHEEQSHHGPLDPHVWTSPSLMRIMAGNTMKALQQADPANATTYKANHDRFIDEIDELDKELHAIFDPLRRPARFMVYHPAWGYFAADYDLIQVPVELEGKNPGPKELASLIRTAKKDNIRVVFVQPQFSRRSAEVIANAIHGRVQPANPLAPNWAENLRTVARAFRAAAAQTTAE